MPVFSVGTFNVRGLSDDQKKENLVKDMKKYNIDICCLQETKIKEGSDKMINGYRLITVSADIRHYGTGFIIADKWIDNISKYWKVSERISVIQIKIKDEYKCKRISETKIAIYKDIKYKIVYNKKNKQKYKYRPNNFRKHLKTRIRRTNDKNLLTIINVYAPTADLVEKNEEILIEMHEQLENVINEIKNTSLLIIAGDMNAKIGKSKGGEECCGIYSKGERNRSGQHLIDLCNIQNLFIANSAFPHAARHITTWENQRTNKNKTKLITTYNQIDYIILPQNRKHILRDARSYKGTLVSSDHRLVVSRMDIELYKIHKPKTNLIKNNKKINSSQLSRNIDQRKQYQQNLSNHLDDIDENQTAGERWNQLKDKIIESAEKSVGFCERNKQTNGRTSNPAVEELSQKQKHLRIRISNSKNIEKVTRLKSRRNKIMIEIKNINNIEKEKELDEKISAIEEMKDSAKMFRAVREINRKPYENPFIHDNNGRHVTQPAQIYKIVKEHFQDHFCKQNEPELKPFVTAPKQLNKPINPDEVERCSKKLRNNRAPGHDKITTEMVKYGPLKLYIEMSNVYNQCFENNEEIDVGSGILVPLPKPNKVKGPRKNLRPVILLPIIRKILSNILLCRIKAKVDEYLSHSQSAYRTFRSTSDTVWTHRWMAARIQLYRESYYIVGIDMSSAFDTIRREKLLDILATFLDEDELRISRLLLSATTLEVKIKGTETEPFGSNIGSPQGDGISGCFFNVYFEYSLRKVRENFNMQPIIQGNLNSPTIKITMPEEAIYADDADFMTNSIIKRNRIQTEIKGILEVDNLLVNETKTEITKVERKKKNEEEEAWRDVVKLGSKIGDKEDVSRRKQLASAKLFEMKNIWIRNDHIRRETKLRLYKAIVKPVLLYNSSTWGLTKSEEAKLDSFHRMQIRNILNIKYPDIVRNEEIYRLANETPISLQITRNRWKLFGHILRLDDNTPAKKAMMHYFQPSESPKFQGQPRTTLPIKLSKDIKLTVKTDPSFILEYNIRELKINNDLNTLKEIAENRNKWLELSDRIYKAAEAAMRLV